MQVHLKSAQSFENITCLASNNHGDESYIFSIVEKSADDVINGSVRCYQASILIFFAIFCVLKLIF